MELLRTVFKDIFTGIDGKSYHMAKISWALSFLFYIGVIIYKIHTGEAVSITDVATGFCVICAGHSAAIYGMAKQEPPMKEK